MSDEAHTPGSSRGSAPAGQRAAGPLRRWLLRLAAATIVPALVLGAVELGLRAVGAGHSTAFLLPAAGRAGELMPNPRFGWTYFPPQVARRPEVFTIPLRKAPGTVRIFVIGSSAAMGFPEPAFAFCRVLEVMLRERFPATPFEVVNAAMVAVNSHVGVDVARDCARYQPDLVIVYEGNNEVIGPWGPGTVFAGFTPSRALIRASVAARTLRIGQLIESLARAVAGGSTVAEWTGMDLFVNNRISADDPRLAVTADHFAANLVDICRAARAAGAPVLLCTVGVNLRDCPPFASLHAPGLSGERLAQWDAAVEAAAAARQAGDHAAALRHLRDAAAIDDRHAGLQFRIGQALADAGDDAGARAAFVRARDLDALRFRTDSALNAVVRRVAAAEPGVTLVDVERLMESPDLSPHGVPGGELFLEHCHLSFRGNYVVARALLDAAVPLLPSAVRAAASAGGGLLGEDRCAERLGLSPLHRASIAGAVVALMEKPPFTLQTGHESMLQQARRELAALRAAASPETLRPWRALFDAAIAAHPGDLALRRQYAVLLSALGDLSAAEPHVRAVLQRLPFDVDAGHSLAGILLVRGDPAAAIAQYERTLDSPWSNRRHRAETFFSIGVAEERRSRPDAARAQYERAIREDPRHVKALGNLGLLLVRQGRAAEAVSFLRRAVDAQPDVPQSRVNLALALAALSRLPEALDQMEQVVRSHPGEAALRLALGDLQARVGRSTDALASYEAAVRLAPGSPDARIRLGTTYLNLGRAAEAEAQFAAALAAAPDSAQAQAGLSAARERLRGTR
jgi:tetratricopeptide (TPR) repeat protein